MVKGHCDEEPDRAMTRAEWEATAEDPAKKASGARELLRLKKKEEGELKARAIAASPAPPKTMARAAPESPIGDAFGALATGDEDKEMPAIPAEAAQDIRKLRAIANETKILKGASFVVQPNASELCQRTANEAHKDPLPADSHVTSMEPIKGEFGLKAGATTAPGLLEAMTTAIACRSVRAQGRLPGLGTTPASRPRVR